RGSRDRRADGQAASRADLREARDRLDRGARPDRNRPRHRAARHIDVAPRIGSEAWAELLDCRAMTDAPPPTLIVVVEDDEPSRVAMSRLLRACGFEPALFDCAEAYIAAPPSMQPLCLILDVGLGGMSGIDLQHRLRAAGCALPIIVTTGQRD